MSCYKYDYCKHRKVTDAVLELCKPRWYTVRQLQEALRLKKDIKISPPTLAHTLNDMTEMGYLASKKSKRREGEVGKIPLIYRNAGEVFDATKKI